MNARLVVLSVILIIYSGCGYAHQSDSRHHATAQYLGNEAVLIVNDSNKVLFDPFFHTDFGIYQLVPKQIQKDIMRGHPPFDDIKLVFVSHAHADHFAAADMLRFLLAQKTVELIAPLQAVNQLGQLEGYANVEKRVHSVALKLGQEIWRKSIRNTEVEAVRIPHAGWPGRAEVENIVFRVKFADGKSVIHMGDADPLVDHYLPYREHWKSDTTDLGFPPYWFFQSLQGRDILDDYIHIEHAVGVHVPVTVPSILKKQKRDFFSKPGETRDF